MFSACLCILSVWVISMNTSTIRVGAQVDPCTAIIFRSIVRSHLLYLASSNLLLTKYSTLHNGISSQSLGYKKYLPKRRNLNSDEAFDLLWSMLVYRDREIKQSPPAKPLAGGRCAYDWVLPGAHCYHHLSVTNLGVTL
jgi:hypothetical protein